MTPTPQDKAKELIEKFIEYCDGTNMFESYEASIARKNAKQCALIAVEEILSIKMIYNIAHDEQLSEGQFYEAVKSAIQNL